MAAIEEELVAGESPEKSVDAGAPGAAESSAEHDPRLSVFRPRDPEDGSRTAAGSGGGTRTEAGSETEAEAEAESGTEAEAEGAAAVDAGLRFRLRFRGRSRG